MKSVFPTRRNSQTFGMAFSLMLVTQLLSSTVALADHVTIEQTTNGRDVRDMVPQIKTLPKGISESEIKVVDPTAGSGRNPVSQIPNFTVTQTPDNIERVRKLEAEGEKQFNQRMLDKALTSWQEAYGMSMDMKFSEGIGTALVNMTRVYLERGDYIKAKYLGENATEVLAESADKKALARARIALARAYFGMNNAVWAGAQLDDALKILTSSDAYASSAEAADALMLAGNVLVKMRKMKEALQFYAAAANYYSQSNDVQHAVATRVSIASFMDELGYFQAALDEANKAASVARTAQNDKPSTIAALAALGMAQYNMCEYANARKSYEEALRTLQTVKMTDVPIAPRAYIDLGYGCCLAATGDLDMAKQVLERTLVPLKAAQSTHGQSQALNVLGVVEELQGQHGRAITYLQAALDLQNVITPKQPKLNIVILQNIAAVEARSGDNRSAKLHLELAAQLFKSFPSDLLRARTYTSLAEVNLKLSDVPKAQEYLKNAIGLAEKAQDGTSLWRDYTLLAKIQQTEGQEAEAKESLASALSHFRSPQAGEFPTPERLGFPSSREDLGEQLVAMVAKAGNGEQALLTAEQIKEESFNNEWHRRGGQVKADDKDIYTDLTLQRAHLHAAEASDEPKAMLQDWKDWLGRFRTLSATNRPLARLVAPVPNSVQDILKGVKGSQTTVVEYLVGADSSVVFTVEPAGRVTATVLAVTRKQLQSQVTALLATYQQPAQEGQAQRAKPLLQALYGELFPVSLRQYLPKSPDQMVAIIPDGCLYNLPFGALIDQTGHYLIEQHTLTLASSIGMFLDSPARYAGDQSVLVAANNSSAEPGLLMRALTGNATSVPDNDLRSLQENARGKSTVHFSNSMSMSSNPFNAQLPMQSKDDGKSVTAGRLFASNLPNNLVVLSGTAINAKDVQGSAVKLFSRGLGYAGARNVLMSLWSSPDQDKLRELLEFYKNEQSGLTQAQSLRRAQLMSISRDPSPRSWACFQLLGPGY